jgi:hypothetical protein
VPEEKNSAKLNSVDQRSDRRLRVSAPIEVVKTDLEGKQFTERTLIEDVSDFGCRFSISGAIAKGATVTVNVLGANCKPLSNESPRQFEIMWVQRRGQNSTVGARLVSGQKMDKVKLAEQNPALPDGTQSKEL